MKKILIIEDEPILRDAFEIILRSPNKYHVSSAENGLIALKLFKNVKPDLVLLDIFMPVMDGKEFLRNLDLQEYPDTKIIVYSNMSDRATEREMKELGAHDFVLKSSLTPKMLLDLVESSV